MYITLMISCCALVDAYFILLNHSCVICTVYPYQALEYLFLVIECKIWLKIIR